MNISYTSCLPADGINFLKQTMSKLLSCIVAVLCTAFSHAQQNLTIKIQHADSKEPLPAATVSIPALSKTYITDSTGQILLNQLKPGNYKIRVSYAGFAAETIT